MSGYERLETPDSNPIEETPVNEESTIEVETSSADAQVPESDLDAAMEELLGPSNRLPRPTGKPSFRHARIRH